MPEECDKVKLYVELWRQCTDGALSSDYCITLYKNSSHMKKALNIGIASAVLMLVVGFLFHFLHLAGGRPLVMIGVVVLIISVIGKVSANLVARK